MQAIMVGRRRGFAVAAIAIICLAALLRWYQIDERSLWYDELITANSSRGSLQDTLDNTRSRSSAPALHPLLLQMVERVSDGPLAVRFPSWLAGVLAVAVLLVAAYKSVGPRGAIIASTILGFSATQIRYSQEVREYSLAVLVAALILLAYVSYVRASASRQKSLLALCALLFVAPFVQYGLVLFGAATVLSVLVVRFTQGAGRTAVLADTAATGIALGLGGLGSWFLTLSFQLYLFGAHQEAGFHYDSISYSNFINFLARRTYRLLEFIYLGPALMVLVTPALAIWAVGMFKSRTWDPILVITVASVTTAVLFALLRLYPYGGMRQCLYLAPVLVLAAAASLNFSVQMFSSARQSVVIVLLLATIAFAAAVDIWRVRPYAEVEDVQSVFSELARSAQPRDVVYVYYQSRPAVKFYRITHPRLVLGEDQREQSAAFATELPRTLPNDADRIWLVFSHVKNQEDTAILAGLGRDWAVERVTNVRGAVLYRAQRVAGGGTTAGRARDG